MALLPCAVLFCLADPALLDWGGSMIWIKTLKMKWGSQYTGGVRVDWGGGELGGGGHMSVQSC